MGFPAIVYNSKTISFDFGVVRIQIDPVRSVLHSRSVAGIEERLNVRTDSIVHVLMQGFIFDNATHETLRRNLEQWFSWATFGNTWTFARDSAKTVNTTLSAAEAAGQTVFSITSTTGLTAGYFCIIRSATHQELVKIASVDSGTQVTIVETLNFGYASGDRFRHEHYWPARLLNNVNPIQKESNMSWRLALDFIEDVNTL